MSEFDTALYDNTNDGYEELLKTIRQRFSEMAKDKTTPLFYTTVSNLFETFLEYLPDVAKQHYNCRTCQHFIDRYGRLVFIDDEGNTHSAMWNLHPIIDEIPGMFREPLKQMKLLVEEASVNEAFVSDYRELGTYNTDGWHHFSVTLPGTMINMSRAKKAHEISAEQNENYAMLKRALENYSLPTIEQALNLIESGSLYRGDTYKAMCKWFKEVKEKISVINDEKIRNNMLWKIALTAPNGFTHVTSSMLGTLMDDISEGLSFNMIKARFEEKMDPNNYRRAQSAPTARAVESAEKVIEKYGIANSLRRRYAKFEEIPAEQFLWTGKEKKEEKKTGVFANVSTKTITNSNSSKAIVPQVTMTWDKFQRTILPTADKIEVEVEDINHLMAMVTAAVPKSENIMIWDNPFSWYYHGGIDSEIKRRLKAKGAMYENCEIRCSLIWENQTDLDIHCITPNGSHIYYSERRFQNGELDVDANGMDGLTNTPVENIRWPQGKAPDGRYKFYVHNYTDRNSGCNPYKVELEINGKIYTYYGEGGRTNYKEDIFEFEYIRGQEPRFLGTTKKCDTKDTWNITNNFMEVKGIIKSPNLWGEHPIEKSGTHVFFLLDECKDITGGVGRGFFTEMLKGEFQEIRKVLEAYTAATPIEGEEEASACGVGYSKDREWNLTIKVTTGNTVKMIKIDRWD